MKKLLIEIGIGLILLAGLFFTWKLYQKERQNRIRLEDNQEILLKDKDYFKWKDEQNTAKIGTLYLTLNELKQSQDSQMVLLKKEVERLGLRLRDVQQLTTATLENTKNIGGVMHDTLIYFEGIETEAKTFRVKSRWNDAQITYFPDTDSVKARIITYDRMTQACFKERRGFKFWKADFWQPRDISQVIHFENPDTKIDYPLTIEISKKRKK